MAAQMAAQMAVQVADSWTVGLIQPHAQLATQKAP